MSKKDLLDMAKAVDSLRDVCNGRIVQLQKSFMLRENELREELQEKTLHSTILEEKIRKQEEKHLHESDRLLNQLNESCASYEQLKGVFTTSEEDRSALTAKSHALQEQLSEANRSLIAKSSRLKELNEELISIRRDTATQLQIAAVSFFSYHQITNNGGF